MDNFVKLFSGFKEMFKILKKTNRQHSPFLKVGFHGDAYILQIVDYLIRDCAIFIETGTNVASTLANVARSYPHIQCLSCEPDKAAFNEALKNTALYTNVLIRNETSQDFINYIKNERNDIFKKECLFWLDAPGYGFEWPLKDEINFITTNFKKGYILIDDFKVPGMDCFSYDIYQEQICSLDFVKKSLNPKHRYRVYYPNYTEKTSEHHPLVGWGLIEFGHGKEILIPEQLIYKIKGPLSV
jgi:hypothetical protein